AARSARPRDLEGVHLRSDEVRSEKRRSPRPKIRSSAEKALRRARESARWGLVPAVRACTDETPRSRLLPGERRTTGPRDRSERAAPSPRKRSALPDRPPTRAPERRTLPARSVGRKRLRSDDLRDREDGRAEHPHDRRSGRAGRNAAPPPEGLLEQVEAP